MNAKNLLALQSVLLVLLIAVVGVGIVLPYVAPPRSATTSATSQAVPTEASLETPSPQSVIPQWEYLSVDYVQNQIIGALYDNEAEAYRYEVINAPEPYGSTFLAMLTEGCSITRDITFDSDAQTCIGLNYVGREYVLSVLGVDGWELVAFDNHSTEYSYEVDMLFKRPMGLE